MDTNTTTSSTTTMESAVPSEKRGQSLRSRLHLPDDPRRETRALKRAILVGLPMLLTLGLAATLGPVAVVVWVLVMAGLAIDGLVFVRRLPRLFASGVIAGGVVGLVVIGGGLRLAMRIVSLTGGRREISIGGTMFLLILGAVLGAFIGLTVSGLLRAWAVQGRWVGMALVVFPGGLLMLGAETRAELLHEGPGGWLNIPMFSLVFLGFGLLVVPAVRWVDQRLPHPGSSSQTSVRRPMPVG